MMTRHPKEFLAWIALVSAILLLGVSFAIAQDTNTGNAQKNKNTISIKITKKENGKTIKIDTTLDVNDEAEIEKLLEQLEIENHFSTNTPKAPGSPNSTHYQNRRHHIVMNYDDKHLSEKEQDEIEKAMEQAMADAKESIEAAKQALHDIHIEINSSDTNSFNFSFEMPEIPEMPDIPNWPHQPDPCRSGPVHSFSIIEQFEGLDSIDDADHLIFFGDEGEDAPSFEKEIIGKNGQKAFVFKRSDSAQKNSGNDRNLDGFGKDEMLHLRYYPNPSNGKFDLVFNLSTKADTEIRIFDPNGKEIYNEKRKDFSGEYSHQLDISEHGRGTYILKISQGDKSVSKKVIVE